MGIGRSAASALVAAAIAATGCGGGRKGEDTSTDEEADVEDAAGDAADAAGDAADDLDAVEEEAAPCTTMPTCPNAPADHERYGQPCTSDLDCGSGGYCYVENRHSLYGEDYVIWPGGTCTIRGAEEAGCDPDDDASCPMGSTCVYLYRETSGDRVYGCLDACRFLDTSWNPHGWNCGCRAGYYCSPTQDACFPGCSNDRECCEVWNDSNGNAIREPSEVFHSDACSNWCDGDDPEEFELDACMASFECINEGDDEATWHSTCLYDADCPPDAYCRNEYNWTTDGEPTYPGGICVKTRCEIVGRGCEGPAGEDLGGLCLNLNTEADPIYLCWATCDTGYGPEDGDLNPCRHADPSHPYTCTPLPDWRFPPSSTEDGYCLPAMVPSGTPLGLFETCSVDEECGSPLGLGLCYERMDNPGYCTARCSQRLAEEELICGAVTTPGDVPPGMCLFSYCRPSCDAPHGDLGSNGCPGDDLACYPADIYSEDPYYDPDGTAPAGVCMPACDTSADCDSFWSNPPYTCNTTDGTCFD
jgi:hypothetical protein